LVFGGLNNLEWGVRKMRIGRLAAALLFAPVLILGFGGPPVEAGSCDSGQECDIHLTNSNTTELLPIDVLVTIDNTGSTTVLEVSLISDGTSNTFQGFIVFGYQSDVEATAINQAGFSVKHDANGDGFGNFDTVYSFSGNPSPQPSPLTFTLASLVTDFPENTSGAEFVVHLQYSGNCSGWASDGTTTPSSNPNCGGTSVAEPGVLFLVGSGMAGLVYLRGRWSRKA
jgi:hypothetical protein